MDSNQNQSPAEIEVAKIMASKISNEYKAYQLIQSGEGFLRGKTLPKYQHNLEICDKYFQTCLDQFIALLPEINVTRVMGSIEIENVSVIDAAMNAAKAAEGRFTKMPELTQFYEALHKVYPQAEPPIIIKAASTFDEVVNDSNKETSENETSRYDESDAADLYPNPKIKLE